MFSGQERVTVATDVPPERFEKRLRWATDRLGELEAGEDGEFTIRPAGDLGSFLSRVKLKGQVEQTDDGYEVLVRYSLRPSVACWIAAVVLVSAAFLGALIVFLPAFEKTTVGDAVRASLRDLKHDLEDDGGRPTTTVRGSRAAD